MGLDLVVEGCARPGHEPEWRRILERSFAEKDLSQAEIARFQDISIPGYERVGAPRVGFDKAADEWIVDRQRATTPDQRAAVLKEFQGYYVLTLVDCDGVPAYSHGGLYEGVDETSFRGSFLRDCSDVLSKDLLQAAWTHRMPDSAISYGRALLQAADRAGAAGVSPAPAASPQRHWSFGRLWAPRATSPVPFPQQQDIVRTAGRWFIFWGERGHPIRAWA